MIGTLMTLMTGTGSGVRKTVFVIFEFHSLDSMPIQVEQREVMLDCPTAGIKWVAFACSSVIPLRIERNNQLFYKFDKVEKEFEKRSGTPFYIDWTGERRAASSLELEKSNVK